MGQENISAGTYRKMGIKRSTFTILGFFLGWLLALRGIGWQWWPGIAVCALYLLWMYVDAEENYQTVGYLGEKIGFKIQNSHGDLSETIWDAPGRIVAIGRKDGLLASAVVFLLCSAVVWLGYGVYRYFF